MLLIVLKIWGKDSGHKRKATSDSTSHGRPRCGVRGAPSGVAHAVVVQPLSVCASPAIARHRPASSFSPTSSYSMRGGPAAAGRWVVISCRQRSGGLETGRKPSPLCPPPSPAVPPPEPPPPRSCPRRAQETPFPSHRSLLLRSPSLVSRSLRYHVACGDDIAPPIAPRVCLRRRSVCV